MAAFGSISPLGSPELHDMVLWIDWPSERIDLFGRMRAPVGLSVLIRWTVMLRQVEAWLWTLN